MTKLSVILLVMLTEIILLISHVHAKDVAQSKLAIDTICKESSSAADRKSITADSLLEALIELSEIQPGINNKRSSLDCSGYIIKGELDLTRLVPKDEYFGEVLIELNFENAIFNDSIMTDYDHPKPKDGQGYQYIIFKEKVNFIHSIFKRHVSLDRVRFEKSAKFSGAQFKKMGSFTSSKFLDLAGFHSAHFDERALFQETTFEGNVVFDMAVFKWLAFFHKAEFKKNTEKNYSSFLYTRFNGPTIFSECRFEQTARFQSTNFGGLTSFSGCVFTDKVWFISGVEFADMVTFNNAHFERSGYQVLDTGKKLFPVMFGDVVFRKNVEFSNVIFHNVAFGKTDITTDLGMGTVFSGAADFSNSSFDDFSFNNVSMRSLFNLSQTKINGEFNITDLDIQGATIIAHWDQLVTDTGVPRFVWDGLYARGEFTDKFGNRSKDLNSFKNILVKLKQEFKKTTNLADAAKVEILLNEVEFSSTGTYYKLLGVIKKYVYGYGVQPSYQVIWSAIVVLCFTLLYLMQDTILMLPMKFRRLRFKIFELPVDWDSKISAEKNVMRLSQLPFNTRLKEALWFSICVFFKLDRKGVLAAESHRRYVWVEWWLGVILFALFLINVSNIWPPLYRLITMVG